MDETQLVPEPVSNSWHHTALVQQLTDDQLHARLKKLIGNERRILAVLIAHLAEFDKRRLYAPAGYPSLFAYCTRELGYSEDAAFKRICVARAALRFPAIISLLGAGRLHLTAIVKLSPHLTDANHGSLLQQAEGKTKREIEFMVAEMVPKPDAIDWIRNIQESPRNSLQTPAQSELSVLSIDTDKSVRSSTGIQLQRMEPTTSQRVRFAFTASKQLLELIERARAILKHKFPAGHLEDIIAEAMLTLLEKRDPGLQCGAGTTPRVRKSSKSRKVPQWVKDEVWKRDGGQCTFLGPQGNRCPEHGGLEFDHITPWSMGGKSGDPGNIRLLCRAHNQWRAVIMFGNAAKIHQKK